MKIIFNEMNKYEEIGCLDDGDIFVDSDSELYILLNKGENKHE